MDEIISKIANEYKDRGLSIEELIKAGKEGLMVAKEKYKPESDFSFESYAAWWIRQRMLQEINK